MTGRFPFDVAAYERAVSRLAAASSAASWTANRAWTMSCSTTMAPVAAARRVNGWQIGHAAAARPPGCADRRTCNVNLDDLRWDRPDLDCEFEQARGIRRNLQLDETADDERKSGCGAAADDCSVRVEVAEFGVSLRGWLRSSDIGCGFEDPGPVRPEDCFPVPSLSVVRGGRESRSPIDDPETGASMPCLDASCRDGRGKLLPGRRAWVATKSGLHWTAGDPREGHQIRIAHADCARRAVRVR